MNKLVCVLFIFLVLVSFLGAQNKNTLSFDLVPTAVSIFQFAVAANSDSVVSQMNVSIKYARIIHDHFSIYSRTIYFQQALSVIPTGSYESVMSISEFIGIQWRSSVSSSCWTIGFQLENTDWLIFQTSDYASGNAYYFGVGIPVGYEFVVRDNLVISACLGWSIGFTYNEYVKEFEFINNPILNTMELSIGYRF